MVYKTTLWSLAAIALAVFTLPDCMSQEINEKDNLYQVGPEASGSFAPDGAPLGQPVRTGAGGNCIVDIKQSYHITGTLSGSLEIDYRIIVYGPCEVPPVPGKYDEEWIASGTFSGNINESPASATFSYTAEVEAGGKVKGLIVFGDGIQGAIVVGGNFNEGKLTYRSPESIRIKN